VAVLLYVSSTLVLYWMPVVKTYALSTLLLFGAFTLAERADPGARGRWLASGLLLGLAVDTRLLFAATVPVFLVHALSTEGRRRPGRRSPALAQLGGLVVGLMPSFVLFALDPSRFVFNNLSYHAVRSGAGPLGGWDRRLDVTVDLLSQFQFASLLVAAVVAAMVTWRSRRSVPLALTLAGILLLASLSPDPPFEQYFVTAVPFLVAGALELGRAELGRAGARVLAASAVVYVAAALVQLPREIDRGYLGGEGEPVAETVRIAAVRDVSRALDAASAPGERVLSFWPGYLFGSHAASVSGFENDFSMQGAEAADLSEARARRYRMASPRRMEDLIVRRQVRLIVHGPLGYWTKRQDWQALIVRSGYRPIATVGLTRVYRRGGTARVERAMSCLRGAGLAPVLGSNPPDGSTAIEVPLSDGGTSFLYVFDDARAARRAAPGIARLLAGGGGGATRTGEVVVGRLTGVSDRQTRSVARCAGSRAVRRTPD
jgi:hypothetical protein